MRLANTVCKLPGRVRNLSPFQSLNVRLCSTAGGTDDKVPEPSNSGGKPISSGKKGSTVKSSEGRTFFYNRKSDGSPSRNSQDSPKRRSIAQNKNVGNNNNHHHHHHKGDTSANRSNNDAQNRSNNNSHNNTANNNSRWSSRAQPPSKGGGGDNAITRRPRDRRGDNSKQGEGFNQRLVNKKAFKGRGSRVKNKGGYDNSKTSMGRVPPGIEALLFDHEFFQAKARQGLEISTRGMDDMDAWLSEVFTATNKLENSEFKGVMSVQDENRIQIPKAKSIEEMLRRNMVTQKVLEVNNAHPQVTVDYASEVRDVLQNNVYFSDDEKDYMLNQIVRKVSKHLKLAERHEAAAEEYRKANPEPDMYEGFEMLMTPQFQKGLNGIEAEKEFRRNAEYVPVQEYVQAATEWDQEAVIDEDEL